MTEKNGKNSLREKLRKAHGLLRHIQEDLERSEKVSCDIAVFELLRQDTQTLYHLAKVLSGGGNKDASAADH